MKKVKKVLQNGYKYPQNSTTSLFLLHILILILNFIIFDRILDIGGLFTKFVFEFRLKNLDQISHFDGHFDENCDKKVLQLSQLSFSLFNVVILTPKYVVLDSRFEIGRFGRFGELGRFDEIGHFDENCDKKVLQLSQLSQNSTTSFSLFLVVSLTLKYVVLDSRFEIGRLN